MFRVYEWGAGWQRLLVCTLKVRNLRFRVSNTRIKCNPRFRVSNTRIKGHIPWFRDPNPGVQNLSVQRTSPRGWAGRKWVILGLYRDNGKENGNYYNGFYRCYRVIWGFL